VVGRGPQRKLRPVRGDTVLGQRFEKVPRRKVPASGPAWRMGLGAGVPMAFSYLYSNRMWLLYEQMNQDHVAWFVFMRGINEGSKKRESLRLLTACVAQDVQNGFYEIAVLLQCCLEKRNESTCRVASRDVRVSLLTFSAKSANLHEFFS
jgi:hypothetical protein